jgi:hypothetical protein
LHLTPLSDLVPAAGLDWLAIARPRQILEHEGVRPALATLLPQERLTAFAANNGGVDLRQVDELAVAHYADTTMVIARTFADPGRVESAFASHLTSVEGRAIDRRGTTKDQVVRTWGAGTEGPEQLVLFGAFAVGLEFGKSGPLRAAELFAEKKLKRASPALATVPLSRAAEILGDAPLRAFAPGPFGGEWSKGLGGLLGGTTAVGLAARWPKAPESSDRSRVPLILTVILLGAWNESAPAAADRLASVFNTSAASGLGHLCGLDRPLAQARTRAEKDVITLEVTLDAAQIAQGLHFALDAEVSEIMGYGGGKRATPPKGIISP